MRRVVVTGLGMVSPLGLDVESSWKALLAGECGIGPITEFDASEFGCRIAGEVKNFDPAAGGLQAKEARRYDRYVQFAAAAATEALKDAGLDFVGKNEEGDRAGCIIGSGIGGLETICVNHKAMLERGPRRISPFMIPGCIINMASGLVGIMKNLRGPNLATVTACATGLHAIGEAAWIIRRGDADVMLAGGTEGTVCEVGIGGFDSMHALSRRNDDPAHASRPFDVDRDGFVMGEGCGLLVLEDYDHAVARGAKIYCELAGYGLSGDAYHITTPATDGPVRSMKMALNHAGLKPAVQAVSKASLRFLRFATRWRLRRSTSSTRIRNAASMSARTSRSRWKSALPSRTTSASAALMPRWCSSASNVSAVL